MGDNKLDARLDQSEVAKVYDRISFFYDVWGKLTESHARNRAIQLAEIRNGQNVLEVAAGTGLAFCEIVRRNPDGGNIGIDLSGGMLGQAEKRLKMNGLTNFVLQTGTAFDLKLQDETIDVLVNNYMFDLIPFGDMERILVEFRRVLKKAGRLVLVNMTEGERFGSRIYDRLYSLSPSIMGGCRGVQLKDRLLQNGFTVALREYYQQLLFPSEVVLAFKL